MRKVAIAILMFVVLSLGFALAVDCKQSLQKEDFTWVGDGFQVFVISGPTARKVAAECKCTVVINPEIKAIFLLQLPEERQT
jgi:hypothetical protein